MKERERHTHKYFILTKDLFFKRKFPLDACVRFLTCPSFSCMKCFSSRLFLGRYFLFLLLHQLQDDLWSLSLFLTLYFSCNVIFSFPFIYSFPGTKSYFFLTVCHPFLSFMFFTPKTHEANNSMKKETLLLECNATQGNNRLRVLWKKRIFLLCFNFFWGSPLFLSVFRLLWFKPPPSSSFCHNYFKSFLS